MPHRTSSTPAGRSHVSSPIAIVEPEPPHAGPAIPVMLFRIAQVLAAISIDRRTFERLRSSGRFPQPDVTLGRIPYWKPDTVRAWVDRGGVS